MTAKEIFQYMVRNGACPTEVLVNGDEVTFDTREVPAKSYSDLPHHIMHDHFAIIISEA